MSLQKWMVSAMILLLSGLAAAATPAKPASAPAEQGAVEKALQECVGKAGKDQQVSSDHTVLDACMEAKGFHRPPPPPKPDMAPCGQHPGHHPAPPPASSPAPAPDRLAADLRSCAVTVGKDAKGEPDYAAMAQCLMSKKPEPRNPLPDHHGTPPDFPPRQ